MATSPDRIADVLERHIRDQFNIASGDAYFTRDAHLYDLGFVDSAGVVELIALIETTFQIELEDDHIFSDAFTTIHGISDVVHQCLQQQRADSEPVVTGAPGAASTDRPRS